MCLDWQGVFLFAAPPPALALCSSLLLADGASASATSSLMFQWHLQAPSAKWRRGMLYASQRGALRTSRTVSVRCRYGVGYGVRYGVRPVPRFLSRDVRCDVRSSGFLYFGWLSKSHMCLGLAQISSTYFARLKTEISTRKRK